MNIIQERGKSVFWIQFADTVTTKIPSIHHSSLSSHFKAEIHLASEENRKRSLTLEGFHVTIKTLSDASQSPGLSPLLSPQPSRYCGPFICLYLSPILFALPLSPCPHPLPLSPSSLCYYIGDNNDSAIGSDFPCFGELVEKLAVDFSGRGKK